VNIVTGYEVTNADIDFTTLISLPILGDTYAVYTDVRTHIS